MTDIFHKPCDRITLSSLFGLARRQTEGFVESIFDLMELDLPVPDHSTVSRRLAKLNITIPVMPKAEGIHAGSRFYWGESIWRRGMEDQGNYSTFV